MSILPIPSFLDDIKNKGLRKAVYEGVDEVITRVTAGMNIQDIREALRGDEPSRRPNPRLTPHADGFFLHIRPSFYHEAVTGIYPTFRLGFLSTFFFFLEVITGLFLMIFYTPSPAVAYENMLEILGNVPMGQFMRDLHRLGAEGMVLFVALHMARTFFTGSYKRPRQFTWFTGSILLLVTLFLSFSGYLLPWDQLAFWAVTIGTSMAEAAPPEVVGTNVNLLLRGAPDIGAGGLLRFYLLHVFALPLVAIVFIFVHYYKVVLHGLSLPPGMEEVGQDTAKRVPKERRVYYIPDVLTTELMWVAMVTFIMVVMVTWFFHAPLENHANPQATPLHTTAPWYFLWLQGMLKLGDKVLMGVVLPTIIFGFLFVMPYIDTSKSRRYAHRRVAISLGLITIVLLVVLTYMGTPWYGVDSAADQEALQELIPIEGVGPIRAVPYDELVITTDSPIYTNLANPEESGYQVEALDTVLPTIGITVPEGDLTELERMYGDSNPEFFHALEETHDVVYEEFKDGMDNQIAYFVISQYQPEVRRLQLIITWDDENSVRQVSEKTIYLHAQSEWHEH
ncbi:MAG: cytochrome bc complex cytochrome b subunit [Anaerolineae bacterium]|nr:cytochrome bc complex cytochrome b subunit [Anaerolineae bacterium]